MAHEQAEQDHQWKRSARDLSRYRREGADRGRAQGIGRTDLRAARRGSEARHPASDARVEDSRAQNRQARLPQRLTPRMGSSRAACADPLPVQTKRSRRLSNRNAEQKETYETTAFDTGSSDA